MTDIDPAAAAGDGRTDAPQTHGMPDPGQGALRTGDQTVDRVLAAVEAVDERPLAEHVAVFEQAHDQLRRALDVSAEHS